MHSYDEKMEKQIFIFPDTFPLIVCICGSTRFSNEWQQAILQETLAGHITLQIGMNSKSDDQLLQEGILKPSDKERLDQLHLRKIDLCDEVLLLNVDGYMGVSTINEWQYAIEQGKKFRWWDKERGQEEEFHVSQLGHMQARLSEQADHLVRRYFDERRAGQGMYAAFGAVLDWFGRTSLDEQLALIQLASYLPSHSLADELIAERRDESSHE